MAKPTGLNRKWMLEAYWKVSNVHNMLDDFSMDEIEANIIMILDELDETMTLLEKSGELTKRELEMD